MAFNGCCTGIDMRYSSEGQKFNESKLKLKPPKSSYEIILPTQVKQKKVSKSIIKVDFKPTKQTLFSKENIPNWIELSFYIIEKKDKQKIIALHIINKSLVSKNPYLIEPTLILYSHENKIDLIRLVPFLIDISVQMKCDIVSFDYFGFGCSSGKPNINNIFSNGEDALSFAISCLEYKIENIILFGKGVGCMPSIYLSNRHAYHNCKGLILYMPIINNKIIDINVMRNIFCQTLLIMEFEDRNEMDDNDVIKLCREIPNEREWLPIRKKNNEIKMFLSYSKEEEDDADDVYARHRSKFIMKLKSYICPEEENIINRKGKSWSIGGSTDFHSNKNLSFNIDERKQSMPLIKAIKDNNILNDINDKESKKKKNNIFDITEIEINNDEDY